jgi:hypothetical protein
VCSSVGYVQIHGSVDDLIMRGSAVAGAADSPHLGGVAECFADGGTI